MPGSLNVLLIMALCLLRQLVSVVPITHRQTMQRACSIFDIEDRFARDREVSGRHPRPIGRLHYFLIGEMINGARVEYEAPIELMVVRNSGGYDLFFDQVRYQGTRSYRRALDTGLYIVRIESELYQSIEQILSLPDFNTPQSFDLEPNFNYPFPMTSLPNVGSPTLLRGSLHTVDGKGEPDVTIQVVGSSNTYLTDVSGQWVLVFNEDQDSEDVTVHFEWADGSHLDVPLVSIEQGQVNRLVQAGLRGWVFDPAGIALPDVRIEVSGHAVEVTSAQDGSWSFYFDMNQVSELVSVTARLSDGSSLTQEDIQVQTRELVIVPNFQFT